MEEAVFELFANAKACPNLEGARARSIFKQSRDVEKSMSLGEKSVVQDRLDNQIAWYDSKSVSNQRWFKRLSTAELVGAAIVALLAGLPISATIIGGIGVALVVIKGVQAQNQYQHNWVVYRSTCEALKHEKYLWLAKAGPYADVDQPDRILAERIEGLISTEHAKWVAGRDQAKKDIEKLRTEPIAQR